ncbi:hypothetical protein EMCRGX_G009512 [Ephydatia muelleri]
MYAVLPSSRNASQKFVIGDNDGVLSCFRMRRGDSNVVFKTLPSTKISRVELGRSSGLVSDKIFVAAGSEVKGYSKKSNNFLTLDTNLAESLQSMCEYFNSGVRLRNIFSNKQAPSRDIANYFANLQSIRYICQGGLFNNNDTCGTGLQILYNHPNVQHFFNGIPPKTLLADKAIYQPGAARKASHAGMQKFSLLQLVTVGVVSATVEELNMMDPPFTVIYHDPILPTAEYHEHYAVVSQSRDLVCTCRKLCSVMQTISAVQLWRASGNPVTKKWSYCLHNSGV